MSAGSKSIDAMSVDELCEALQCLGIPLNSIGRSPTVLKGKLKNALRQRGPVGEATDSTSPPTKHGCPWSLSDDLWLRQHRHQAIPSLATHLERSEYAIECRLVALEDPEHSAFIRLYQNGGEPAVQERQPFRSVVRSSDRENQSSTADGLGGFVRATAAAGGLFGFGGGQPAAAGNMFGGAVGVGQLSPSGGLFGDALGGQPAAAGNLFGGGLNGVQPAAAVGSFCSGFGGGQPAAAGGLFGADHSAPSSGPDGLSGEPAPKSSTCNAQRYASGCSRCGHKSHVRSQCYATWNIDGQVLHDSPAVARPELLWCEHDCGFSHLHREVVQRHELSCPSQYTRHQANSSEGTPEEMFLYVLQLEDECWYVGTTKNCKDRLYAHRNGHGSAWTRAHAVMGEFHQLKQLSCTAEESRFEEDKITKMLMLKHGIKRVRGGSYCRVDLPVEETRVLKRELHHATDACLRCGNEGHWVHECSATSDVHGDPIVDNNIDQSGTLTSSKENDMCEEEV